MHVIAWVIPLILTALPMTTNNAGASSTGSRWCVLVDRNNSAHWLISFWEYMCFFVWMFICIALMITWQLIVSIKFQNSAMKGVILRTYDKVYLYPVAMVVCWGLDYFCDEIQSDTSALLSSLSVIFAISNGIFSALIFLVKSEESRRRWVTYFYPPATQTNLDDFVEPPIQSDFEDDLEDEEDWFSFTNTKLSDVSKPSDVSFMEMSSTSGQQPVVNPIH